MTKKIIVLFLFSTLAVSALLFTSQKSEKVKAMNVLENETLDTENRFYDDFTHGIDQSSWYISKRVWGEVSGRTNGGVIPENVFYDAQNDSVKIRALGNQYAKNEVTGVGSITDGSCTGGALVSKFTVTPGRYEVRMKVAPRIGVCNAIWIYNEDSNDKNHEIDFELPGKNSNDVNTYDQILCTNYVGSATSKNYKSSYTLADNEYHTYVFDWYYSENNKLINYYIDDVLVHTSTTNIPFYENRLWIGAWIPNNEGFVGLPNFESAMMEIDYVSFTPFLNQTYTTDDCYISSDYVASVSQYPSDSYGVDFNNKYPNGDFEYVENRGENYTNSGLNYTGSYSFIDNSLYGKSLQLTDGSVSSTIDTILQNEKYTLSLTHQGEGEVSVEYYDVYSNYLGKQNIILSAQNIMTSNEFIISTLANTHSIKVTISGTNLIIDDIKLFPGVSGSATIPTSESYSASLINNDNAHGNSYHYLKNQTIAFDGNEEHPFLVSSYQKMDDGYMRLGYYADNLTEEITSSENASIGNYTGDDEISLTYKQLYANAISKNDPGTFFVQAVVMQYDIQDFSDIAFYFHDLNAEAWQALMIHYSIDSGETWSYLNHTFARNAASLSTNGIDVSAVSATSQSLPVTDYENIRFAMTTTYYGNMNSQVIYLGGIVINNYSAFKNKIDGDTCSLSSEDLDLLNVLYAHTSSNEKEDSKKVKLINYDKTYFSAYNEIIARYDTSNTNIAKFNDKNIIIFIVITLSICFIAMFVFKQKNSKGDIIDD